MGQVVRMVVERAVGQVEREIVGEGQWAGRGGKF